MVLRRPLSDLHVVCFIEFRLPLPCVPERELMLDEKRGRILLDLVLQLVLGGPSEHFSDWGELRIVA